MCQEFGIETGSDVIPQIAAGFAGGIGNTGSVCGAVAGGVMAIGLKQGRSKTVEETLGKLAVAGEFRRRFEAEMGAIGCRELTGLDLSLDGDVEELIESDVPQNVCFPAVGTAFRLVVELLRENE